MVLCTPKIILVKLHEYIVILFLFVIPWIPMFCRGVVLFRPRTLTLIPGFFIVDGELPLNDLQNKHDPYLYYIRSPFEIEICLPQNIYYAHYHTSSF